jgi:hypothetical protein
MTSIDSATVNIQTAFFLFMGREEENVSGGRLYVRT